MASSVDALGIIRLLNINILNFTDKVILFDEACGDSTLLNSNPIAIDARLRKLLSTRCGGTFYFSHRDKYVNALCPVHCVCC